jgi:hypothetical protein
LYSYSTTIHSYPKNSFEYISNVEFVGIFIYMQ